LLKRLSQTTGGKVRDTLAGVFNDRDAKRFAYQDLANWLVLVAACSLLLSVATRRLALPDGLQHAPERALAWLRPRPQPKRAEKANEATPPSALDSLLEAKARSEAEMPAVRLPPPPARPPRARPAHAAERPAEGGEQPPPSVPRFSQPPPAPGAETPAGGGGERKLTAAEVLLARRRGRKG
jgi:hypothetical protein